MCQFGTNARMMSSSLYGTSDYLPYYMGVVFEENNPCLRCDLRLWSFPPGPRVCLDRRDLPFPPRWLRWPSVPEGTKCDDIVHFYDPLGPPERCCSYDSCGLHGINRGSVWWKNFVCLKHQVIRVKSILLFLRKHEANYSWLVIKLLSNATDLAAIAIDPKSCWMLVDVLRRIMRGISKDYSRTSMSVSNLYPELLRDLSNVWLSLDCKAFYTVVLPDLVRELPHVSYRSISSRPCWFITKSTVLILLHRVSRDFLNMIRGDGDATFYEIVMRNDDWLIKMFKKAMKKCTPVAVILSFFLPKSILLATCRTFSQRRKIIEWRGFHRTIIVCTLRCMTLARMSPSELRATVAGDDLLDTEAALLLLKLDSNISLDGLATMSLLTMLRTHGIAWVVRHFREKNYIMPSSMWTNIHRYFHGTSWRYVCVMKYYTIMRQMM